MTTATRWGILGTGSIAKQFARGLADTPDAVLQSVGSRAQDSADAFGETFSIPTRHASYEALANDPDLLTCGPMTGAFAEIGGGTKRLRVRRGPCGLPSCGCALEFWSVRRRNPVPEPGWLHVDVEELPGGCPCGGLDRDSTRYRPRR